MHHTFICADVWSDMWTIRSIPSKAVRAVSKCDPSKKLKELEMPSEGEMRGEARILKCMNSCCRKQRKALFCVSSETDKSW